ncbi:alpha/beta hydrolase [Luteolibacter arcticus]|uniref:Alpha/beta hydrolase n=1 Tax=Luteolibacter arcticus TaxID=1581411 RepID=A0ABT3GQP0_9BACT|nr:alpha/beta hydrolase [Luteolibacter arcticus]MCW1925843.1 alpha/beta hydrolase [Luteolibacter arcticus]
MIPSFILVIWLSGLIALAGIGGAAYLFHDWYQRSWGWDAAAGVSVFAPSLGWDALTAVLAAAVLLLLFTFAGRPIILSLLRIGRTGSNDMDSDPRPSPVPESVHGIDRPDGSRLHVECYGEPAGIPLIATHGWGLTAAEWNYLKRDVPPGYRLIVWDLPGLGSSTAPSDRDFSLLKLAGHLGAVVEFAAKPAVLVGHSIGGMIVLTYMALFPHASGSSVRALMLVHTTPTDPVKTTSGSAILLPLEVPLLKPLMYLTIALSPLIRLMNWLSYANGTTHLINKFSSFAGEETWQQVDFAARFSPRASPAVLARGMLAMMRYDAFAALPLIKVPTLVVAGDRDSTTKPSASRTLHEGIAGARLIELSPAKHLGLIEHHVIFRQALASICQLPRKAPLPALR